MGHPVLFQSSTYPQPSDASFYYNSSRQRAGAVNSSIPDYNPPNTRQSSDALAYLQRQAALSPSGNSINTAHPIVNYPRQFQPGTNPQPSDALFYHSLDRQGTVASNLNRLYCNLPNTCEPSDALAYLRRQAALPHCGNNINTAQPIVGCPPQFQLSTNPQPSDASFYHRLNGSGRTSTLNPHFLQGDPTILH